jgi:hypothetical protein
MVVGCSWLILVLELVLVLVLEGVDRVVNGKVVLGHRPLTSLFHDKPAPRASIRLRVRERVRNTPPNTKALLALQVGLVQQTINS